MILILLFLPLSQQQTQQRWKSTTTCVADMQSEVFSLLSLQAFFSGAEPNWNARSKQRHFPDAKQVLWKGWVLKQRLNDVQSRFGATATRAHVESPLRTELFVDSCSVRHQGNCCASTREMPASWTSIRTQGTERCSCDKTAALTRHKHTWISPRAQRDMFRRKDGCVLTRLAHLDLSPCARRHVHATTLLNSHAVSTLGSFSVRKETCSGEKTAAFSRREHTWISLRPQEDLFMRQHWCVRTL